MQKGQLRTNTCKRDIKKSKKQKGQERTKHVQNRQERTIMQKRDKQAQKRTLKGQERTTKTYNMGKQG